MKDILVDEIRLDRKKVGFNSSINSLIKLDSKETENFIISHKEILEDYINCKNFIEYIKKSNKTNNSSSKFIFSVFNLAIFLRKFN